MSSIIAASCCCKKYPPPPPQVGIWYYCKPRVCVEGFNRCFAPRVDEFITFLEPEVLALLSDNDWLDQYKWVSGGQYWELGAAIGPGTLSEIREQLGLDRVEPVAMRTREVPYVAPDNEFLVIPDHRVTGNSGPTAQPRATESLVLNQYDPDGDLYQITFHIVPSFIAHMHSTVPLFPQWAGRASIANALPPNVRAKNGQPTKEFALARYRRPQQGEGFGAHRSKAAQPNGMPQLREVPPVRLALLSANRNDTPAALSALRRRNPRQQPGSITEHVRVCARSEEITALPRPSGYRAPSTMLGCTERSTTT